LGIAFVLYFGIMGVWFFALMLWRSIVRILASESRARETAPPKKVWLLLRTAAVRDTGTIQWGVSSCLCQSSDSLDEASGTAFTKMEC